MLKKTFIVALAVVVTAPTLASAVDSIRQRYTLPAAAIDSNSFEIVEADGAGNAQLWCGAGIYARRVLGERGGDITIEMARGPSQTRPGRKAVRFTTDPAAAAAGSSSLSLNVRREGVVFTMTHAYALCRQFPHLKLRTGPNTLVRK
ncbi:hypothetical protein [uncultured Tateyamaria sp.]|uniref:hypothetical protein n=1 Tax=uncultured Tateyamaria sp. TaxID=455651 RepID=UPI002617870E|nr:hypothetical protein [uncultured Tateyamaria sp.]